MKRIFTLLLFLHCFTLQLLAQPGTLDLSFNPGVGPNGLIFTLAIQSDGKILIAGDFTSVHGTLRNGIARLNADGTLDNGFDPGAGTNSSLVRSIAMQGDGKLLIAGDFISYNGTPRNRIARLNADGTLDTGFDPGTGTNSSIQTLAVQNDGKILIGGNFASYNGDARNRIARLNADGSLDTGFDPGTGANMSMRVIAIRNDGKIMAGGNFVSYNGTPRNGLARVNADGTLDTSLDPGTGANSVINAMVVLSDGKILIGGDFSSYNGTPKNDIVRLNTDGTLDLGFDSGLGVNGSIQALAVQSDGQILIGGDFAIYNGTGRSNIARINADGTLDTRFDPGTGTNNAVHTLAVQSDGKVLIGGSFTDYNGTGRNHIARIIGPIVPVIASLNPTSGPVGTSVTITGQNFNTTASNNVVMFGATRATVTAASATSLTVTVPMGATYSPITVLNTESSLIAHSKMVFVPTFSPNKASINSSDIAAKIDFGTTLSPETVIATDLDNDGKPDLAVSTRNARISVLRNTGSSGSLSFAARIDITASNSPGLAVGDLDNDGKPDMVITNGNDVMVYRNTSDPGSISFAAGISISISTQANSFAIADLDGDGKSDIVTANPNNNTVTVLSNTGSPGNISFGTQTVLVCPNQPLSVAVGDLDNDGKPDIAASNYGSSNVSVFHNIGTPGNPVFAGGVLFSVENNPGALAAADIDGDGGIDLVTTNTTAKNVSVLLNTGTSGNISFAPKRDFPAGDSPYGIAIADVNGDSKPEIVIGSNSLAHGAAVLQNISSPGTPNFAAPLVFGTGTLANAAVIADLNGDTKSDMAITTSANTVAIFAYRPLFFPEITSFTPASAAVGASVTFTGQNFNTTASNNVVMFGATRATVTAASATSLTVTVPAGATYVPPTVTNLATGLSGQARSAFIVTSAPSRSTAPYDLDVPVFYNSPVLPDKVLLSDLDGDGKPDAIYNYWAGGSEYGVGVSQNLSAVGTVNTSSIGPLTSLATGMTSGTEFAIGDLDGDGRPDIIVINSLAAKVMAFRNTSSPGAISFAAPVDIFSGAYSAAIIHDMDKDGKPDIVLPINSGGFDVRRNIGVQGSITTASFSSPVSYQVSLPISSIAAGDIDGDGKPEIAATESLTNKLYVFQNTSTPGGFSAGSFAAPLTFSSGTSFGHDVGIADLNSDGKPELIYRKFTPGVIVVFRNVSTPGTITTGSLEAGVELPLDTFLDSYKLVDFNGDGHADIVSNVSNIGTVVLENKGLPGAFNTGSFTKSKVANWGPVKFTMGDIDGDGKADVIGGLNMGSVNIGLTVMHNRPLLPQVQASNVQVSNLTDNSATITWTNGDGAKRAVFRSASTTGQPLPLNNTTYIASPSGGPEIGSTGWFCVYNGTGNTVNIDNLLPGTNYRVMVVEYGENNWQTSQTYLTSGAAGNPVNLSTQVKLLSINRVTIENTNAATVSYLVTFNGPLTGVTTSNFTLTATGITGASITGISGSGSTRTVTVNTGTGDGTLELNLSNSTGFSAVLTNTLPFAGLSYTINKTAPRLTSVSITTNNTYPGWAKLGSDVVLTFNANEFVNTPVVTIEGHAVTPVNVIGRTWSASWTMASGDTEGVVPFSINFVDAFGNAGTTVTSTTNGSSMIFDKTRPTLSPVSIASNGAVSSKANTDDVITLAFTASEPVTINSVMIGGNSVTATNIGGNSWSAAYRVKSSDNEGQILFSISYYDNSGNPGSAVTSATNGSSLTIDRTNADLADLTLSAGNLSPVFNAAITSYTASVPAGTSSITVTPTASAPGSVIRVRGTIVASGTASQPIPISAGQNAIGIIVTSLNGSLTRAYTLLVSGSKSNQEIVFNAIPEKTYGDVDFALNASGGASGNPLTFTSSNPAVATVSGNTITIMGAGTTTITSSQAGNANYNAAADVQQTLTVNKATLMISADNKTKQSGDVNPPLTVSYNGFIPGENSTALTVQPTISTPATTASPTGTYPITASGATAANYTISYTAGTLTITAPANHAPTDIVLSRSDIGENNLAGAVIGTLSTVDPDPNNLFSYSLVSGTGSEDNTSFTINGIELRSAVSFDFETKAKYSVRVRVTDQGSLSTEKVFTITVNDVLEFIINQPPTLNTISSRTQCYTTISQQIAMDGITPGPESGQSVTVSVSGSNNALLSALTVSEVIAGKATLAYTFRPGTSGTVTITVTVKDDGGTDHGGADTYVRTFTITVNPLPMVGIESSLGIEISKGITTALSASGGTSYVWSNAAGIISGQNSAILTVRPDVTTTYTVTATTSAGCAVSRSFTVTVLDDLKAVEANNIMTPNGDGKNEALVIKNIDMYPDNRLQVFDRAGRMIYQKQNYQNDWTGTFEGSSLVDGTYFYILEVANKGRIKGYLTILRNR